MTEEKEQIHKFIIAWLTYIILYLTLFAVLINLLTSIMPITLVTKALLALFAIVLAGINAADAVS